MRTLAAYLIIIYIDMISMSIKIRALTMGVLWAALAVASVYFTLGIFFVLMFSFILAAFGLATYMGRLRPTGFTGMSEKEFSGYDRKRVASITGISMMMLSYSLLVLACLLYSLEYVFDWLIMVGTLGYVVLYLCFNSNRFKRFVQTTSKAVI